MAGEPFEGEETKKESTSAPPAPVAVTSETATTETTSEAAAAPSISTGEAAGGEDVKVPGDEEDTGAVVAPIVRLEEVVVSTGEENEDVLLDLKSKLYRFDKDGNQWKERGVGQVKLLLHKETKKIRLLMRQSRTLKICANHLAAWWNLSQMRVFDGRHAKWVSYDYYPPVGARVVTVMESDMAVIPATTLQEHAGSDKSWVWHASDYSDGELKEELFCLRLGSVESAQKFKSSFEEAQEKAGKIDEKPDAKADEAADALGSLKVADETEESPAEVPAVDLSV